MVDFMWNFQTQKIWKIDDKLLGVWPNIILMVFGHESVFMINELTKTIIFTWSIVGYDSWQNIERIYNDFNDDQIMINK